MELRFEGLKKHYGANQALKGISLTLTEGIYGLLGPNGAGKSTMMNILTGNLVQSGGRICFDGEDIRSLGSAFREKIGYMPQQQAFYPGFSVEQFLYYMASLRGMSRSAASARIDWALALLSLEPVRRKSLRSLSGGMRQRALLAQAILADPDVLILDEPTAGLDPKQRIAVRNLIAQIALHKIVILSTHVVPDVEFIAKELILLSQGQVLCQRTPKELLQELDGCVWEASVQEDALDRVSQFGLICGVSKEDDGVLVRILSQRKPEFPCRPGKPCLEDVYLHYFGEADGL